MSDENMPTMIAEVGVLADSKPSPRNRRPLTEVSANITTTSEDSAVAGFDALRELDEVEVWRDRNEVVTAADHQNNHALVVSIVDQLVDRVFSHFDESESTVASVSSQDALSRRPTYKCSVSDDSNPDSTSVSDMSILADQIHGLSLVTPLKTVGQRGRNYTTLNKRPFHSSNNGNIVSSDPAGKSVENPFANPSLRLEDVLDRSIDGSSVGCGEDLDDSIVFLRSDNSHPAVSDTCKHENTNSDVPCLDDSVVVLSDSEEYQQYVDAATVPVNSFSVSAKLESTQIPRMDVELLESSVLPQIPCSGQGDGVVTGSDDDVTILRTSGLPHTTDCDVSSSREVRCSNACFIDTAADGSALSQSRPVNRGKLDVTIELESSDMRTELNIVTTSNSNSERRLDISVAEPDELSISANDETSIGAATCAEKVLVLGVIETEEVCTHSGWSEYVSNNMDDAGELEDIAIDSNRACIVSQDDLSENEVVNASRVGDSVIKQTTAAFASVSGDVLECDAVGYGPSPTSSIQSEFYSGKDGANTDDNGRSMLSSSSLHCAEVESNVSCIGVLTTQPSVLNSRETALLSTTREPVVSELDNVTTGPTRTSLDPQTENIEFDLDQLTASLARTSLEPQTGTNESELDKITAGLARTSLEPQKDNNESDTRDNTVSAPNFDTIAVDTDSEVRLNSQVGCAVITEEVDSNKESDVEVSDAPALHLNHFLPVGQETSAVCPATQESVGLDTRGSGIVPCILDETIILSSEDKNLTLDSFEALAMTHADADNVDTGSDILQESTAVCLPDSGGVDCSTEFSNKCVESETTVGLSGTLLDSQIEDTESDIEITCDSGRKFNDTVVITEAEVHLDSEVVRGEDVSNQKSSGLDAGGPSTHDIGSLSPEGKSSRLGSFGTLSNDGVTDPEKGGLEESTAPCLSDPGYVDGSIVFNKESVVFEPAEIAARLTEASLESYVEVNESDLEDNFDSIHKLNDTVVITEAEKLLGSGAVCDLGSTDVACHVEPATTVSDISSLNHNHSLRNVRELSDCLSNQESGGLDSGVLDTHADVHACGTSSRIEDNALDLDNKSGYGRKLNDTVVIAETSINLDSEAVSDVDSIDITSHVESAARVSHAFNDEVGMSSEDNLTLGSSVTLASSVGTTDPEKVAPKEFTEICSPDSVEGADCLTEFNNGCVVSESAEITVGLTEISLDTQVEDNKSYLETGSDLENDSDSGRKLNDTVVITEAAIHLDSEVVCGVVDPSLGGSSVTVSDLSGLHQKQVQSETRKFLPEALPNQQAAECSQVSGITSYSKSASDETKECTPVNDDFHMAEGNPNSSVFTTPLPEGSGETGSDSAGHLLIECGADMTTAGLTKTSLDFQADIHASDLEGSCGPVRKISEIVVITDAEIRLNSVNVAVGSDVIMPDRPTSQCIQSESVEPEVLYENLSKQESTEDTTIATAAKDSPNTTVVLEASKEPPGASTGDKEKENIGDSEVSFRMPLLDFSSVSSHQATPATGDSVGNNGFRPAAQFFADDPGFDELARKTVGQIPSHIARDSLYVKFDPLLGRPSVLVQQQRSVSALTEKQRTGEQQEEHTGQHQLIDIEEQEISTENQQTKEQHKEHAGQHQLIVIEEQEISTENQQTEEQHKEHTGQHQLVDIEEQQILTEKQQAEEKHKEHTGQHQLIDIEEQQILTENQQAEEQHKVQTQLIDIEEQQISTENQQAEEKQKEHLGKHELVDVKEQRQIPPEAQQTEQKKIPIENQQTEEQQIPTENQQSQGTIEEQIPSKSHPRREKRQLSKVEQQNGSSDKQRSAPSLKRSVEKTPPSAQTDPSASMLPPQHAPLPVSAAPLKLHDSLPAAAALPASAAAQPSSGQLGSKPLHRPSAAVVAVVRPEQKSSSAAAAATSSTAPSSAENPHQIDLRQQDQLLQRDRSIDQLLKESAALKEEISRIRTRNQRTIKLADMSARAFLRLAARNDRLHADNRRAIEVVTAERTEARDELVKMESLFSDLNRKFEKSRTMISESKQRSELVTVQLQEAMASLATEQQRYQILQQHSEDTFQSLKAEKDALAHSSELETLRLTTKLRLAENKTSKLEQENRELTALCDELIQKMGGAP